MELSLPNFETLEKRIQQLSQEIGRIRERHEGEQGASPIPDKSRKTIEKKIKHLLDLLREY